MNYTEVLGHAPTAATIALLDKLTAYVEQKHAQHPDIPESVYWDDILDILTNAIKQAEG